MDQLGFPLSNNNNNNFFDTVYYAVECRLYFNRHFAHLTELRDFTGLIKIMAKFSMKSDETIYNHTNLQDKNEFN